jgi:protein-S-isoprenylcysteine O-methyltransferase Ste14
MAGNEVTYDKNEEEAGFRVLIERDSITKFYVLILTASPLLLLFVMIRQTYLAIRNGSGLSSALPLEAVVGLIAIVPLRQVLVPNSIPGLTTIDVILGGELVLFVTVVTIASFWPHLKRPSVWRRSRTQLPK